jgi:ABC-type branched-subunit amino acid transport system ATPase component
MGKITHLALGNITAFSHFEEEFSPGINTFIGVNGTGKTHILKILYSACSITSGEDLQKGFPSKIRSVFHPFNNDNNRLLKHPLTTNTFIGVTITRDNNKILDFSTREALNLFSYELENEYGWQEEPLESTYIPVKEMLAHAPGFLSTVSKRELAFEEVYTDIIKRAFLPKLKELPEDQAELVASLQKAIGGKVTQKGEYFFI